MIEVLRQNADKFWNKVDKRSDSECWPWTKSLLRGGYGHFQFRHNGKKKSFRAHRVSYMLTNDVDITKDELVCHKCDNPICVNPNHLVLGDNFSNMGDCVRKGRQAKGSGHGKSKLTEPLVVDIRRKIASGQTKSSIAKEFNVSVVTIVDINHRRTWKHIPVEVGR